MNGLLKIFFKIIFKKDFINLLKYDAMAKHIKNQPLITVAMNNSQFVMKLTSKNMPTEKVGEGGGER